MGDGEIGDRSAAGVDKESCGLVETGAVEIERESLGLADRASILMVDLVVLEKYSGLA